MQLVLIAIRFLKGIALLNVSGNRLLKSVLRATMVTGFTVVEQQHFTQKCMSFTEVLNWIQEAIGVCIVQGFTALIL